MRTYLSCPRRKCNPKVALDVCKVCRHNAKCPKYLEYRRPRLFT